MSRVDFDGNMSESSNKSYFLIKVLKRLLKSFLKMFYLRRVKHVHDYFSCIIRG